MALGSLLCHLQFIFRPVLFADRYLTALLLSLFLSSITAANTSRAGNIFAYILAFIAYIGLAVASVVVFVWFSRSDEIKYVKFIFYNEKG